MNHTLSISWSTSRGVDTYGYNICRLDDNRTGRRYRTCGGGYDMIGTVIGEWLADVYQSELQAIGHLAGVYYSKAGGYQSRRSADGLGLVRAYLYGMTRNDDTGRVTLDGACGTSTMIAIAEAIGLRFSWFGNRKGQTLGYFVSPSAAQVAA